MTILIIGSLFFNVIVDWANLVAASHSYGNNVVEIMLAFVLHFSIVLLNIYMFYIALRSIVKNTKHFILYGVVFSFVNITIVLSILVESISVSMLETELIYNQISLIVVFLVSLIGYIYSIYSIKTLKSNS